MDPGPSIPRSSSYDHRKNLRWSSPIVRLRSVILAVGLCVGLAESADAGRLEVIRQRGFLACGVSPGVSGFSEIDNQGRYTGFDIDMCRALAAAIFGTPEKVRFVRAESVQDFIKSNQIDVVSRRLTWSLTREGLGLLFGPITFYDGQGFLLPKRIRVSNARQLAGKKICVAPGTLSEFNVGFYFRTNQLDLKKVFVTVEELANAFNAGRCDAYTADVSELGAMRSKLPSPNEYQILSEQISKEPLAQVVRSDDVPFFDILRWTVFAIINAEELGINSRNVDDMLKSTNPDVQRLLGVTAGNGRSLGLDEKWAYQVIKTLGNYGEIFARTVGDRSAIKLDRGFNRLWTDGGLIYAPPLR